MSDLEGFDCLVAVSKQYFTEMESVCVCLPA